MFEYLWCIFEIFWKYPKIDINYLSAYIIDIVNLLLLPKWNFMQFDENFSQFPTIDPETYHFSFLFSEFKL